MDKEGQGGSDNEKPRKASLNGTSYAPLAADEKIIKDNLGIYNEDVGSPLVRLMFDFFTDPKSSKPAYIWGQLTAWLSILRVLEIAFESCDGPNQYVGRPTDNSRYYFFLTDSQYWKLYIACMVPLIIDAVGKLTMLSFIVLVSENNALYYKLRKDRLEQFLLFADIVGTIPFLVTAVYLRPYDIARDNQAQNVVTTLLELLCTARILRLIKDMPPIRSIRIALLESANHLVLPVFFFFMFNITSGVFLYFVEPCYNVDTCPWKDLFESSFFSIVTMTTTGYGNQIPQFEFGRFVACCVMVFGALFLSMPLAIIGNEYDYAWNAINDEIKRKKEAEKAAEVSAAASLLTHERMQQEHQSSSSSKLNSVGGAHALGGPLESIELQSSAPKSVAELAAAEEERKRKEFEADKAVVVSDPVLTAQKTLFEVLFILRESSADADFVSPSMLLQFCELQAQLPAFLSALRHELNYLVRERSRHLAGAESLLALNLENTDSSGAPAGGRRRLSVLGGGKAPKPDPAASAALAAARAMQLLAIQEQAESEDDSVCGSSPEKGGAGRGRVGRGSMNAGPHSPEREGSSGSVSRPAQLTLSKEGTERASETPVFGRGRSRRIAPDSEGSNKDEVADNSNPGTPTSIERFRSAAQRISQRQSLFLSSIAQVTSRSSMINRLKKVIGNKGMAELRARTGSADFDSRAKMLARNPTSWRTRLWILLELPHSSKEARTLQGVLIFLISFSIFILYTQTIVNLTPYGESSEMCGKVLSAYCGDKWDNSKDPGCFVHFSNGTVSNSHLLYGCTAASCFRRGTNFGATGSNVTCLNHDSPPFQDMVALDFEYGQPYLFTSREKMHLINPICTRIECMDNSSEYTDVQFFWVVVEFVINIAFTVELLLRIAVTDSIVKFVYDYLNIFDALSIAPFYVELFKTLLYSSFDSLNFSILASSPDPIFFVTMRSLKVFRMFKLTRHFNASKVIVETAQRGYKQILGMISFLVFLVILFAILLYQVESGRPCFVGDDDCHPPADALGLHVGDKIQIDKNGDLSHFSNVFYGLWYSFVTLTSTGYGDIVAVTNAGQVMSIILMLMGSFYLAMPLTAAATTFYSVHMIYEEKRKQAAEEKDKQLPAGSNSATSKAPSTTTAATAAASPAAETASSAALLHGDCLDRKLQKRVNLLLGELFLLQSALTEFHKDMHQTSTEYDDDAYIQHSGSRKHAYVEINNRKIPILKTLHCSSSSRSIGGTGNSNTNTTPRPGERTGKSELLQQLQSIVRKLEGTLAQSEEDILRLVVLHHKLRKNF